jgi:hypothetical protein
MLKNFSEKALNDAHAVLVAPAVGSHQDQVFKAIGVLLRDAIADELGEREPAQQGGAPAPSKSGSTAAK